MRKIWFTSDQHFGHLNVIKYCNRPFSSVEEMNEELVRRHNAIVGENDLVMHLGDFSLWKGAPAIYLPRLNGEHHLIAGNHDWCHPVCGKKKVAEFRQRYLDAGFKSIALEGIVELEPGLFAKMHHMPYLYGDATEDVRYRELRPEDNGNWLLHGHVHTTWKIREKCINVGVDQWAYAPVSLEEIIALIRSQDGI